MCVVTRLQTGLGRNRGSTLDRDDVFFFKVAHLPSYSVATGGLFSLVVKRPVPEADNLFPYTAKYEWSYTHTPSVRLYGVDRDSLHLLSMAFSFTHTQSIEMKDFCLRFVTDGF